MTGPVGRPHRCWCVAEMVVAGESARWLASSAGLRRASAAKFIRYKGEAIVSTLLPVNTSTAALRSVAQTLPSGSVGGQDAPPPVPEASDLVTWEQESYELDAKFAASVGFPLWSVDTNDRLRVMLFGVSHYSDVTTTDHVYRYGLSIRVLLEIIDSENKAKLSLPAIAAQVELGAVQANSQLIVVGYSGDIGAKLPGWQAFDVDSYSNYVNTVNDLKSVIFSDTSKIHPALLSSTLAASVAGAEKTRKGFWHRYFDAD